MNDTEYGLLKKKIHELLDIDLEAYKTQQMRRRLDAFVTRRATGSAAEFVRHLGADAAALEELRNMLTINVSEFFRDPAQWQRLQNEVLPELLRRNTGKLKIWSSACSNGQEPYTIAAILAEASAGSRAAILATDIDRVVLERARAGGPYNAGDLRNVPQPMLRYFTQEGDAYRVVDTLRKRVEFRELNLLASRFDRGYDLIVCRNVMIYFSDDAKQQLFRQFYGSLAPGGALFVGGTEALLGSDNFGFERIGGNFYRKGLDGSAGARSRLSA